MNCSIQVETLLQTVNLNLDYGDGQSTTISITGNNTVVYGIDIPTTLSTIYDSYPNRFILINSETYENGYFDKLEIFASTPGMITLWVNFRLRTHIYY